MIWSLLAIALTVIAFIISRKIAERLRSPLANPLIISVMIVIAVLLLTKTSYPDYFAANSLINDLLQPVVVALAFPLYQQLHQIRTHWKSILLLCFSASVIAMVSGTFLALGLGGDTAIAATVLPKSVTTPIAMTIAEVLGGIPSISAICVLCGGLFGSIFGHVILNRLHINKIAARGLSIGAISHALGTARCVEISYQEAAYSSLAFVVCGVITSLLAPILFPFMLTIYHWF